MTRLIQAAWLLPCLWLFLFAARVWIADLREDFPVTGGSWPCADLDCDCCEAADA